MADFDLSDANLPFNIDAEQIVLGSLIIDSSSSRAFPESLRPSIFTFASTAESTT